MVDLQLPLMDVKGALWTTNHPCVMSSKHEVGLSVYDPNHGGITVTFKCTKLTQVKNSRSKLSKLKRTGTKLTQMTSYRDYCCNLHPFPFMCIALHATEICGFILKLFICLFFHENTLVRCSSSRLSS